MWVKKGTLLVNLDKAISVHIAGNRIDIEISRDRRIQLQYKQSDVEKQFERICDGLGIGRSIVAL